MAPAISHATWAAAPLRRIVKRADNQNRETVNGIQPHIPTSRTFSRYAQSYAFPTSASMPASW